MSLKLLFAVAVFSSSSLIVESSQASGAGVYVKLSSLLKPQNVARMSIIHRPTRIETPVRMDDKALRQFAETRVTFDRPSEYGLSQKLLTALAEINTAKRSGEHDVRWGILVYDAAGNEHMAIFLDRSGKFVKCEGEWFEVRGETMGWINRSVQEAFR
jgi:hypothetical protein